MKKLWILTEERPKRRVIGRVIDIAAKLLKISYIYPGGIRIIPRIENGPFEKEYIHRYYPDYRIIRSLVLYGGFGQDKRDLAVEVGFWLNSQGRLILGISAPKLFIEAVKNLLDYWKSKD